MLGQDLEDHLMARGFRAIGVDKGELDITQASSLEQLQKNAFGSFDWIVNCAAYTAVDQAESEIMPATRLNGVAPGLLAFIAKTMGTKLIHLSTDFVFDGAAEHPYHEESLTHPLSSYGRTKRMGEENVQKENPDAIILRTSWLYGPNGKSFPRTMIEAWLVGKSLKVVNDQTGCPTSTHDLSRVIGDVIAADLPGGVYHATGPEVMTWHSFATLATHEAASRLGVAAPVIEPCLTQDWPTPAPRPKYSVLDNSKLQSAGIAPMRPVVESLQEFINHLALEWNGK
jgi:dTDP-4-dehydrorhamnose reductase